MRHHIMLGCGKYIHKNHLNTHQHVGHKNLHHIHRHTHHSRSITTHGHGEGEGMRHGKTHSLKPLKFRF